MSTSLDLPTIKGFDAIKESRKWKRDSWLRRKGMTFEEEQAYLQKVNAESLARRNERLRKNAALAVH